MLLMNRRVVLYLLFLMPLASSGAENWPQFRGGGARRVTDGTGLPEQWNTTENVQWKITVPGRGWSSPIVWGDKIFLTTAVSEGEVEPPKKGLYFGGERKEPSRAKHQWL